MKKKWITKSEIAKILKIYSIRKDEFRPVGKSGYFFQSNIVTGYTIQIEQESLKGEITVNTNRIIATHSQSDGKKTYVDVWERDQNGDLQFRFRNLWNQPLSDADYICELEQKIMQLQQAGQKLQDQLTAIKFENNTGRQKSDNPRTDNLISHKLINDTNAESKIIHLRKQIDNLEEKYQKLKNDTNVHNARGAGRKPSQERLDAIEHVRTLIESGCSEQDILKQLKISRATFYRYKKDLKPRTKRYESRK